MPFANAGPLSAKLLRGATLKAYPGLPHGMPTAHADRINVDLLAFVSACRPDQRSCSSTDGRPVPKTSR